MRRVPKLFAALALSLFSSLALSLVSGLALSLVPGLAHASTEEVRVAKVLDDDEMAIVVRADGQAYLIEKGLGCSHLRRFEGRRVVVHSPESFLGIGAQLILPGESQSCRIWDVESLGSWADAPAKPRPAPARSAKRAKPRCTTGHWVQSVSSDGRIVLLNDHTVWEVDAADAIDAMLWIPSDDVIECGNQLIHKQDALVIRARRVR